MLHVYQKKFRVAKKEKNQKKFHVRSKIKSNHVFLLNKISMQNRAIPRENKHTWNTRTEKREDEQISQRENVKPYLRLYFSQIKKREREEMMVSWQNRIRKMRRNPEKKGGREESGGDKIIAVVARLSHADTVGLSDVWVRDPVINQHRIFYSSLFSKPALFIIENAFVDQYPNLHHWSWRKLSVWFREMMIVGLFGKCIMLLVLSYVRESGDTK